MKKLVLIGGGENGRIRNNGEKTQYETYEIDREIKELTQKENPNFLFMAFSQIGEIFGDEPNENIKKYYDVMSNIFGKLFNCKCDLLTIEDLENKEILRNKVINADIIYEGGGSTKDCIEVLKSSGLDKLLKEAYEKGVLISGISAGMNMQGRISLSGEGYQINKIDKPDVHYGLNFIDAVLVPHYDKDEYRRRHLKMYLAEHKDLVGIAVDECCALEIIDNNQYKIITTKEDVGIHKCYYKDENYIVEDIKPFNGYKNLKELIQIDN